MKNLGLKKLSVVVPIRNEAEVLEELTARIHKVASTLQIPYELIYVDDGSEDSTLGKLDELRKQFSAIVVVELARNYGQTAALAAGIDWASGDTIITMDGDLQHEPEEIPRFLSKLDEGFDVVSGWREERTDNAIFRKFPSWVANAAMRHLSGIPVRDFGSTFKAYNSEILKKVDLFGDLHRFIPVLAYRVGARITEIPICVKPRVKGVSKYGLGRIFGVFQDLIFLEFYSNHLTRPMRAFGKLFFLFFGTGFLISLSLVVLWMVGRIGAVLEHSALLLFSVFLMIIGVQFMVTGILAELLTRIYLNSTNSKIYNVRRISRTQP
jgi:glycosyltransferase involved in cell wall biosynthesis